jgi:putative ABC transport system permease protein
VTSPRRRREFGANLRSLFGWRRPADDVAEELRFHAEMRARDGQPQPARASGVVAECAAIAAGADRATRRGQWLEEAWHDLRHAGRALRARPGVALGSILIIGLGLGANTAIVGLVNAVYFQPLPIDPDGRLVRIREYRVGSDGSRWQADIGRRSFDAVTAAPDLVSDAVLLGATSLNLVIDDVAERIPAVRTSAGFTRVLRTAPVLGRAFTPDEEQAGEDSGALLISQRLWDRAFGRAPDVVGRHVKAEARAFTIVGVMPTGFDFPYAAEAWLPGRFAPNERSLAIFGHLAPGLTLPVANERFEAIGRRLNEQNPDNAGLGLNAVSARQSLVGDDGQMAIALMGSVAMLLLIACANVTMLITSRLVSRQQEVVIRAALGCGRGRQVRHFITETLLLFALGGVAGWALAVLLKDSLVVLLPRTFVDELGMRSVPLDLRVAAVAMAVAMAAGLAFGLVAALRATRGDINAMIKDGSRSVTGGRSRRTVSALVVVEIALALVLVAGAGLLIQNAYRISRRDPGFRIDGLFTFQLDFRGARYAAGAARTSLLDDVIGRLQEAPGVEAVGMTTVNPFCCGDWGARISVEGQPAPSPQATPVVGHQLVTPGWFAAMGIALRDGRVFTARDREGQAPVAIVDEGFARRFWPGQSAIGKRVKRGQYDSTEPWMTVVGVVAPIEADGDYPEAWYLPYAQWPLGPSAEDAHLMVRSTGNPAMLLPAVRRAVAEVDATMPVFEPTTMAQLGRDRHAQDRIGATVTGTLAALGLVLATIGVYGLMSAAVSGDTRNIGIRLALGASSRRVLGQVLARAIRLAATGAIVGVPLALLAARLLRAVITDVEAPNLTLLAGVTLLLLAAAAIAALIPARRAVRIDPLRALRE